MKPKFAPIVQLEKGLVRGTVQEVDDAEIYLYQGIRYGRAGRFEKPTPVEPWEGILEVTSPTPNPPQLGLEIPEKGYYTFEYDEDCLRLNVWKPLEEKEGRAVMVYIYGGAFKTGSIDKITHDCRWVAHRGDVIVVSMNYRVGPFGFLYGDDTLAPGNLAVHDQILALQWVQENIPRFGGDPNNVTLFGNSSGSISIGMHLLSPLSVGLFHRAAIQSGVPTNIRHKEEQLSSTRLLAKELNCNSLSMGDIIASLKSKTVKEILKANAAIDSPFRPVYGDTVMPVRAIEALKGGQFNGNIDLLYGACSDEGVCFSASKFSELDDEQLVLSEQSAKEYVVKLVGEHFGEEAFNFYRKRANLPAEPSMQQLRGVITSAYGDNAIIVGNTLFAEHFISRQTEGRTAYSWMLSRPAAVHIAGMCNGSPWMQSLVGHADELYFLFTITRQATDEDRQFSIELCKAWAQFAKTGHPGPLCGVQWTPAIEKKTTAGKRTTYLDLNLIPKMVSGHFDDLCSFWEEKIFL